MPNWFEQNAPKKGNWFAENAPDRPAGLPEGQALPGVAAHPEVALREPEPTFAGQVGGRLKSNATGLITPLLHPYKSAVENLGKSYDYAHQGDVYTDIADNPNKKEGVANAIGDTLTAAALGGATHYAPKIGAPIAEGMKSAGGKIFDNTVGLHMKDVRFGAQPGRAYLEGGGTPAITMEGLADKAGNVRSETGNKLGAAYDAAGQAGVRIPATDVLHEVSEPISKLRTLKQSAGGTGITPEMVSFEDSLMPPIGKAALRGGFSPTELFSEMKKPISENTRWNDPTMYDLNKVRQQTVGRIGGLLTDAVPETAELNKIYQGSGNLANRAKMRSETGQTSLRDIGRHAVESVVGGAIGYGTHNPYLAVAPLVLDSIPVKTTAGYGLFKGGRILPRAATAIQPIAPFTPRLRTSRPEPRPEDAANQ